MINPTQSIAKTNVRYLILVMIFIVTVFNYVDRATLSIAAPSMRTDLGFDAMTMGIAFSAFGWAYTSMQLPGGIILDRFGSRLVLGMSLTLRARASLFKALSMLVFGVGVLIAAIWHLLSGQVPDAPTMGVVGRACAYASAIWVSMAALARLALNANAFRPSTATATRVSAGVRSFPSAFWLLMGRMPILRSSSTLNRVLFSRRGRGSIGARLADWILLSPKAPST